MAAGSRRGGPATSMARVTAIVNVMNVSMKRMSGLAKPRRIGEDILPRHCAGHADGEKHTRARNQREPQPRGVRLRRFGQSRHHDDHPHRGENGAALKGAARLIGADPEDVDADENPDRRQHLGEERQRRLGSFRASRAGAPPQYRSAASDHTPTTASTSTTFSSIVSNERKAIRTAVTGLPRPVSGKRCSLASGQRGTLVGKQQHDAGQRRCDKQAKSGREQARQSGMGLFGSRGFGSAQARGGADEQDAGHAAADRRLRQRNIDREQPNPDQREQQPIDHVANRRRERSARENGPGGDRKHQEGEAEVERLKYVHAAGPLRRTARPMSWAAVAPAN